MGYSWSLFSKDILLDDDAFEKAAKDFIQLSKDMNSLKKDINRLLTELKQGFDTPAGKKFMESCESGLLKALEDQANVIEHVSNNLQGAKQSYQSVFAEYEKLNRMIGQS